MSAREVLWLRFTKLHLLNVKFRGRNKALETNLWFQMDPVALSSRGPSVLCADFGGGGAVVIEPIFLGEIVIGSLEKQV